MVYGTYNHAKQCNYCGCGFTIDIKKGNVSIALLTVIDVIIVVNE